MWYTEAVIIEPERCFGTKWLEHSIIPYTLLLN